MTIDFLIVIIKTENDETFYQGRCSVLLHIVEQALTPEIFSALRERSSFLPYEREDVAAALSGSLYTVEVRDEECTVGIARIVGDDRIAFFIKDVSVAPSHRGLGVGRLLMDAIFSYIRSHACERAYIGLMATPGTEQFYERFGFIRRPAPGLGHGMVQFLGKEEIQL